jgi:putative PIN family toxin of toxin-antitoxin system
VKRWVVDTNVLVSALLFRGPSSAIRDEWRRGRITLLVDRDTLLELSRVLAYPKFGLSEEVVAALLEQEILPCCEVVETVEGPPICADPDDDRFLWLAREARAEAVASGGADLLDLAGVWEGIPICSVRGAVDELARG